MAAIPAARRALTVSFPAAMAQPHMCLRVSDRCFRTVSGQVRPFFAGWYKLDSQMIVLLPLPKDTHAVS